MNGLTLLIPGGKATAASPAFVTEDAFEVGGYGMVWKDDNHLDAQGEYFTKSTQTGLKVGDRRPMYYQHGQDGVIAKEEIGEVFVEAIDDVGVKVRGVVKMIRGTNPEGWYAEQIDLHNKYIEYIREMRDKGLLGWSAGSTPYLVEVAPNKSITNFPVGEWTLTPTPAYPLDDPTSNTRVTKAIPADANPLTTPVEPTAKEVELTIEADADSEIISDDDRQQELETMDMRELCSAFVRQTAQQMGREMSDAEVETAVNAVMQALGVGEAQTPEQSAAMMADPAQVQELGKAIAAVVLETTQKAQAQRDTENQLASAIKSAMAAKPQAQTGNRTAGTISDVRDMKYAHLTAKDLVFGAYMMRAAKGAIRGLPEAPDETYLKATAEMVWKDLSRADGGSFKEQAYAVKSTLPFKADEVFATNLTNSGSYWVGAAYETQLWEAAREATMYREMLSRGMMEITIPQGNNTVYIPAEGTDPTFYKLAEQNDLTSDERLAVMAKTSTPTVTRRQITPGVMGARVAFTDIEEEDSLIPVLPFFRSRMETAAQEQIEYVFYQGDTETGASANINLIDGTPSVDAKGRGPNYLTTDGIFKLPLVTTTALSRSGNALDEEDFLATWRLLPTAEQMNVERLMFVLDASTYMAALNIAAVKTKDVFTGATIEGGQLAKMWGVPVFRSGFIGSSTESGKTNTAGKISSTAANNAYGRILIVRPDQWAVAYKRQLRTEVARDIDAQATIVVSTMRFGLTYRNASGSAAVTYNLTI